MVIVRAKCNGGDGALTTRSVDKLDYEEVALPVRMRAAIESLPYETPKMSAVAIAAFDGQTFAEALERCIERSKGPLVLNGAAEELPAATLKKQMSRYRRF